MSALNPKQRAFVMAYVENGNANAAAAARAAGYGGDGTYEQQASTTRVTGWRLVHDKRVLEAIKELAQGYVTAAVYRAMSVLVEIAEDPTHKDRLAAAEKILNRAGMLVVAEQKITVEHRTTNRLELLERIKVLAEKTGTNVAHLLEDHTTDAEFTPVEEPAMSSEGLEDLL